MIKLECQVFFNMDVQVFKVDLTPSLQEISPIACTSDIQQHPKKKLWTDHFSFVTLALKAAAAMWTVAMKRKQPHPSGEG